MPSHNGFIDPDGQPRFKIAVIGRSGRATLEPIMDTGFSGFLAIPANEANRLGIRAYGRLRCVLADGGIRSMPTGIATIALSESEVFHGVVILSEDTDALLGLEFIREAHKGLYLDRSLVVLLDEAQGDLRIKLLSA